VYYCSASVEFVVPQELFCHSKHLCLVDIWLSPLSMLPLLFLSLPLATSIVGHFPAIFNIGGGECCFKRSLDK